MEYLKIEKVLVSEIKLKPIEAKIFLLVTCNGKMTSEAIAKHLGIDVDHSIKVSKNLINLGAFIDLPNSEFEAMHPRFTVVNMYRRMCENNNIEFKRNKIVDSIGVVLEKPYDDARTK